MGRIALLSVLLSPMVLAQPRAIEDKRPSASIQEIERGFYFEARGGYWATLRPPTVGNGASGFSSGQAAQVDMGFDIGERVGIAIFILGTANRMSSDYIGYSGGTASGDYGGLMPGLDVKVRFVGFNDAQEVPRTWLYARLAGAAVLYNPRTLLNSLDVLASGGLGVEYFTKLRHFSVGLEANFNFMVLTQTFGFSVFPTVKYSF